MTKRAGRRSRPSKHYGDARDALTVTGITLRDNLDWVGRFAARTIKVPMPHTERAPFIRLCAELYAVIHLQLWSQQRDTDTEAARLVKRLKTVRLDRREVLTMGEDAEEHEGNPAGGLKLPRKPFYRPGFETWRRLVWACQNRARYILESVLVDRVADVQSIHDTVRLYPDHRAPSTAHQHDPLEWLQLVQEDPWHARQAYTDFMECLFLDRLGVMLQAYGTRLRRCEASDCRRVYVMGKVDARCRWCSNTCKSRLAMRKSRIDNAADLAA